MATRYVGKCKGKFKTTLNGPDGEIATLLWGDPVRVLAEAGGSVQVKARGWEGWVSADTLVDQGLLEIYVIDVGQGDGVLWRTPDDKWHLMDAGVANRKQMTKKGTANFVRWKFQNDLGQQTVSLADVVVTHPDFDHYGGLLDLLAGKLYDGRTFPVQVETLYHSGLAKFAASPILGATAVGTVPPFPHGDHGLPRNGAFITELLGDKASFAHPPRALSETFAEYAQLVSQVPNNVRRLDFGEGYLPGYAPGQSDLTIAVLGPVLESFGAGQAGLRDLGTDSRTVNGHSIVLLLEYGAARILLTGDLNIPSQQLLLSYHPTDRFAVDLVKACHHGSEDVYLAFLQAMKARATVISSGDSEDYSHPRPVIVGASGRYGREARGPKGETLPPLVYSTELARSVKLDYADGVLVRKEGGAPDEFSQVPPKDVKLEAGDWDKPHWLRRTPISTDLIYGLVNVRTDGQQIMCATMLEKGNDFDVKLFQAGVDL